MIINIMIESWQSILFYTFFYNPYFYNRFFVLMSSEITLLMMILILGNPLRRYSAIIDVIPFNIQGQGI